MARRSSGKPWLHANSGYWCSTLDGERVYLDKDYRVACRKLKQRVADARRAEQGAGLDWLEAPIAELADEFLDHIQATKKPSTHESYRYRLLKALKIVGPRTRVVELGKLHLARIEARMNKRYSPTTIKDTIATLQAVFSWAQKHDLLIDNPLAGYQKPAGRVRTRTVTDEEFRLLIQHADASLRDVLVVLRHTGCRPIEARTLIWEWVDLDRRFWILPDHKTITRQRQPLPRVIPLTEEVLEVCRRLAERPHKPADHVFLNAHGKPYNKDTLSRKMQRLRTRAGIQPIAGEQLVLYSNRHTFGTQVSGRVSDIELAALLGHTDVRTTQRYTHFNPERLQDIRRRAAGPTPGSV